jgi:hypothetical protein
LILAVNGDIAILVQPFWISSVGYHHSDIEAGKGRVVLMDAATQARLIEFLTEELAIPSGAIAVALRHQNHAANPLPMVLWQYGLITLEQLDQIFDWMETA